MRSFDGPYGLSAIQRWMADDAIYPPLRVEISAMRGSGKTILNVKTAGGGVVMDAYKDGMENMQEALQWMADLAGAMTGMEVEVSIYKE